jgi:hypothetical protein
MVRGVREREGGRFTHRPRRAYAGVRLPDRVPAGHQLHRRIGRGHGPAGVRRAGRPCAGAAARRLRRAWTCRAGSPSCSATRRRAFPSTSGPSMRPRRRRSWPSSSGAAQSGSIFLGDPENEARRPWSARCAPTGSDLRCVASTPRVCRPTISPDCAVRVSASVEAAEAIFSRARLTPPSEVFDNAREAASCAPSISWRRGDACDPGAPRPHREPQRGRKAAGRRCEAGRRARARSRHTSTISASARRTAATRSTTARRITRWVSPRCLRSARLLAAARRPPKRSMLFLALTAEEKGLLGAYHFASRPTVPPESLVANVNMDMPLLIGDVADVVPIGIEHSTLEGRGAARRGGGRPHADAGPVAGRSGIRAQRPVPVRAPGRAGDLPEVGRHAARRR